jgi:phosphopantothenoylcysteine decarboxylase/phosphopantothenate--cysteine ligase
MHPSHSIRGMKSAKLRGKRIVLGITGSIAAVHSVELARELIRYGADVHAVMSREGTNIITPWAMEFATGNPVTVQIDGRVQHVALLGDFSDKADLFLIAPCTANTLSKIACGIDDTTVTTMATIAIGSKVPVLLAPAMHASMFENPMVKENMERLERAGIGFIGPRMEGKKAKIADTTDIVAAVLRQLGDLSYQGKKVLVVGGSSEEPIDGMRVITNRGTGETAVELAQAAYEMGAEVELWMGRCSVPLPGHIPTRRFRTVNDLIALIDGVDHDLVLVPAALSDFAPVPEKGKISSGKGKVTLELRALPKVLPLLTGKNAKVIGFKAGSEVEEEDLLQQANACKMKSGLNAIVANDLKDVLPGQTKVRLLIGEEGPIVLSGSKAAVASDILRTVRRLL